MKVIIPFLAIIFFTTALLTNVNAQTKPDSIKTATVQDTSAKEQNLRLLLDQIEIQGWLEKPQMVYVVPGLNPEIDDIILERSFINEILRPLRKDKFEKRKIRKRKRTVIPW